VKIKFTYSSKLLLAAALVLLTSFTTNLTQESDRDTNAKFKAQFVVQFTKNIEWPDNYKEGNFIVGVLGNSSLMPKLNEMAATFKVGNQPFSIVQFDNISSIGKCHILIIPTEASGDFLQIQNKLKNASTLIVTDKPGLGKQGSCINFVIQDHVIKIELNKTVIEKLNMKVSAQLPKFAAAVF
jgi:hypothetical protein